MRWPLALLTVLLSGVLLLPFAFPVAADGDDDGGRDGQQAKRGDDGDDRDGDDDRGDDDSGDDDSGDDDSDEDEGDGKHQDATDRKEREGRKDGKHDGRRGDDERRGHGKDKERQKGNADPAGDDAVPQAPAQPGMDDAPRRAEVRVGQDYDVIPGALVFTFRVTNHGQSEAKDVQLDGALPDVGTWVLTDVTRCRLLDDGVDCALGDLAPGEIVEVQARSLLVGEVPPFTNVVQVYTPMAQPEPAPSSP